jgi:hypothetical protein|tara:strand:- start:99 stop:353 length:255 start_codon:yes stop_codon:yes gene_type:complete
MAFKIYQDAVTKELVIDNGIEFRYPAFSEIQRQQYGDFLILKTVTGVPLLDKTLYSDLTDLAGTAYASFAALKTALDGYFDATI